MTPSHLAAALLMVTIWGAALRAGPCGEHVESPFPSIFIGANA
ncbi:MAG TPA: hypothetical protein VFN64_03910 [Burkholderiaceae bacterium]|nr:hypothetical protein [Burkholderiaceae bacterium]